MMMHRATRWLLSALVLGALLPAWAKDPEERIAFQRNDPPAVTVMFADGSSAVDLSPNRMFSEPCVTPALSPDGRTLVFSAKVGEQFKLFTWQLNERNETIGEPKRLLTQDSGLSEKFPAWAPDGKRIAFLGTDRGNTTTLRVANADGTGVVLSLTPVSFPGTPTWSPDGQQLLYIDTVENKPVLYNIVATGGKGLPVRPESRIIAASYAPDGKQIAALVQQDETNVDLYVIPPFGIGGHAVLKGLVGAKSIVWRNTDTITFNAAKVGTQAGKAFWTVTPNGENLQGVTGYADPKQVGYFSVQKCDLTPYVPVVATEPAKTAEPAKPPIEKGLTILPPDDQNDMTDLLVAHSVSILSPLTMDTVRGTVPVTVMSRKNVAKITILVNGKFAYTVATAVAGNRVPKFTYNWNSQELRTFDPKDGIPTQYEDLQEYPDGNYTICAQALDANGKVLDQHIITVAVQNAMAENPVPGNAINLQYGLAENMPDQFYLIHGEGQMIDDQANTLTTQVTTPMLPTMPMQQMPQQAMAQPMNQPSSPLNATLDAAFRRSMVKAMPNDLFGFATELRTVRGRSPFTASSQTSTLPELSARGAYTLTKLGELTVASNPRGDKAFLPLTQVMLPVQENPVKLDERWLKPMWVVTDLFDREATQVNATHRVDGFEWINGHKTARVRSEYQLKSNMVLRSTPATTVPGIEGTRAALLEKYNSTVNQGITGGGMPPMMGGATGVGAGTPYLAGNPATGMPPMMGGGITGAGTGAPYMGGTTGAGVPPLMGGNATMGGTPGMAAPSMNDTKAKRATGVRYSWIDLEAKQLVRVEDIVLYTVPVAVMPTQTDYMGMMPINTPGLSVEDVQRMRQAQTPQQTTRDTWYLVRYQYTYIPVPQQPTE